MFFASSEVLEVTRFNLKSHMLFFISLTANKKLLQWSNNPNLNWHFLVAAAAICEHSLFSSSSYDLIYNVGVKTRGAEISTRMTFAPMAFALKHQLFVWAEMGFNVRIRGLKYNHNYIVLRRITSYYIV